MFRQYRTKLVSTNQSGDSHLSKVRPVATSHGTTRLESQELNTISKRIVIKR